MPFGLQCHQNADNSQIYGHEAAAIDINCKSPIDPREVGFGLFIKARYHGIHVYLEFERDQNEDRSKLV